MRKTGFLVFGLLLLGHFVEAQRFHLGLFGGVAAYNGDLTEKAFPRKTTNGAVGLTGNYALTGQLMLRAGFTYAVVGGADRFSSKPGLIARNLAFETSLAEFSLVGEYYLFNLDERRFSPYVFAGLGVFHFNPYAYTTSGEKVYLKPLSTEGQGLEGYPDRKPYSLTQINIPFGGGVKYAITENLRLGLEFNMRKLFTDYLDDVSKNYVDPADLLAARGQLAVDMSYRGDELPGGDPDYPAKDLQRGSPKNNDWYYTLGLHLTYRFGNGNGSGFGGRKGRYGCPTVPL